MLRTALLALLLSACNNDPLTLVTYNTGLAVGFVPGAVERAPGTAAATAALDADIVCLQEVWDPEHMDTFETAMAGKLDHVFWADGFQETGDDPGCTADDIDPLIDCFDTSCADACIDELPDCLITECALPFLGLEKDCMRCVQANVGHTPEEVRATCTTELTEWTYDGSFGTGIASAWPIEETEEEVVPSTTSHRSVLHAVIDAPAGDVDVYCTHLTAVFALIPYPRAEGTWADEQRVQIDQMLAWVDETASTGRTVLMGDMNAGPQIGDIDAEQPANWARLAAAGMYDPFLEDNPDCTFCSTNGLSSVDSDRTGKLIDHVFLDGFAGETTSRRVLDEEVEVQTCGQTVTGAHSDHYGVEVTTAIR